MAKKRRRAPRPSPQQGTASAPDAAWAEAMGGAMGRLKDQFDNLGRSMTATGRTTDLLRTSNDSLTKSTLAVVGAYGLAKASLEGWVRSGLSGTTTADQLSYQTQLLGRSIASIFVPSVEAGIQGLRRLTDAFNGLSGSQQEAIRRTSLMVVGVLGAVATIPKLTSATETLGKVLKGLVVANPFVAVTAGLIGLLSLSDRGRESLSLMGERLLQAFEPLADLFTDVILPALENFIDVMAQGSGQFLLFSTLVVAGVMRIISAVRALQSGISALGLSITLATGLVSLLMAAFQKTQFQKFTDELAAQVRAGRLTIEQAKEEIRREAEAEAERRAEGARGALTEEIARQAGTSIEEAQEALRGRLEEEGLARLERARRGRRDAVLSGGGQEDPRATIRRLEQASVKVGDPNERTAAASEAIFNLLKGWGIEFGGGKPNPNAPVKGD